MLVDKFMLDYLFYRITNVYLKRWNERNAYLKGCAVVILLLEVNVYSLFLLLAFVSQRFRYTYLAYIKTDKDYMHSWMTVVIIALCITCIYIFNKKRYVRLAATLDGDSNKTRYKKGWLITAYIVLSIALCAFLRVALIR